MRGLYAEYVVKKKQFEELAGQELTADSHIALMQEVNGISNKRSELETCGNELIELSRQCATQTVSVDDIRQITYAVLTPDASTLPKVDRITFGSSDASAYTVDLIWTNTANNKLSIKSNNTVAQAEQCIREQYSAAKAKAQRHESLEEQFNASVRCSEESQKASQKMPPIKKVEEPSRQLTIDEFKNSILDKMVGNEVSLEVGENKRNGNEAQSYYINISSNGRGSKYLAETKLTQELVDTIFEKLLNINKTSKRSSPISSVSEPPRQGGNISRDSSGASHASSAVTVSVSESEEQAELEPAIVANISAQVENIVSQLPLKPTNITVKKVTIIPAEQKSRYLIATIWGETADDLYHQWVLYDEKQDDVVPEDLDKFSTEITEKSQQIYQMRTPAAAGDDATAPARSYVGNMGDDHAPGQALTAEQIKTALAAAFSTNTSNIQPDAIQSHLQRIAEEFNWGEQLDAPTVSTRVSSYGIIISVTFNGYPSYEEQLFSFELTKENAQPKLNEKLDAIKVKQNKKFAPAPAVPAPVVAVVPASAVNTVPVSGGNSASILDAYNELCQSLVTLATQLRTTGDGPQAYTMKKIGQLALDAQVELCKPLNKILRKDSNADVSQRDEYKLLQSLRDYVKPVSDATIVSVSKEQFEQQIASSNVSSRAKTLLKAVCVAVVAALGFIVGAVIGAAAGGALGSVTGPGAVATATIGAVVVGAKAAVASAAVGAGVAGALTAYGLFRDPKAIRLCKQVVKEVEAKRSAVVPR